MGFINPPIATVIGDGRVISTGPTTLQFPGPLLPNIRQQPIMPEGIQQLLSEAEELGLFARIEYVGNDRVYDAPTTAVTITVGGETYVHTAYALDELGPESDPPRVALSEFVATMTDLPGKLGDQIGPDELYPANTYLIYAAALDLATMTFEIEPTVVPWPGDAPVRLADVGECAEVPADVVGALFAEATQLTFFSEAEVTYEVVAVQQYPGRAC